MERWEGRTALVTGASAGIGEAVSEILVKHGVKVVGCARNIDKLQEMSETLEGPGSFHPVQCDLTDEDQILEMFKQIKKDHGGVDICINNAGHSHNAPFLSGKSDQWRSMIDVNVMAVAICTREAFKTMKNRSINDGHIINISSMSGHRVTNNKNGHFYAATKFFVKAMTDGVRNELKEMKSQIKISEISPGLVETEFFIRKSGEKEAKKVYERLKCLEAQDIANAVIYMLSAPPHVEVHDILIRPTAQTT